MRTFKLPTVRSELAVRRSPDLIGQWSDALEHVRDPVLRLRAALSLAAPLASARHAIVFDEDGILAGVPGHPDAPGLRRLFDRARRVVDDELITRDLYVARLAPERTERLALGWRSASSGAVELARAIVASARCAFEHRSGAHRTPAGLPDLVATLERIRQLIHDERRMRRAFAVVFIVVETPAIDGAREVIAGRLRRAVRANDHLGYAGDDAFVVLVALGTDESEAHAAAQRLVATAAAAAGGPANAGVATCPVDGVAAEDLLEKAGAAALAAASVDDPQPFWYRESAGRSFARQAAFRAQLADGDPGAVVELVFQPVVDAQTGHTHAVLVSPAWRQERVSAGPPLALLGGASDRHARELFELWLIARAAETHRELVALTPGMPVMLVLSTCSDAMIDALARGFGRAARQVWVEIATVARDVDSHQLEAFVRRVRALGAAVGVGAGRAGSAPFNVANGLLDFVVVDAGNELSTLAGLAVASVVAPSVLAAGVRDADHARWLLRNGATALRGDGIAQPMSLNELVRWASDHSGSVAH